VLRFENVSPDGSLSWVGRALSEVITAQLAGVPGVQAIPSSRLHSFDRQLGPRPISAPGISTESTEAILAGAGRLLYGEYTVRNGHLEVLVTVEDTRDGHMTKTLTVTSPAGDVLGAADRIARLIDVRAAAFGTRNGTALSEYIGALESGEATRMEQKLSAAIQADPDFPAPYGLLAQLRAQRGDRPGAVAVLEQATARGERIPPIDRARFALEAAEVAGDTAARHTALQKLVQLDASDPTAWRALGESSLARHEYKRSMESFQKAVELEPRDAGTWNLLGYAAAYAGDLPAGTAALQRYQALTPTGANPLDSLGDIYLISGKLTEAEQYFQQSFQKEPDFNNQGSLLKIAIARLYGGDVTAADQAAGRYFAARAKANDPILEYRKAQWLWLTGRRKQGLQQMMAFADAAENTPVRDSASRAIAEVGVWKLMLGDRAGALQLAERAFRVASPPARGNGAVAGFMAMPPASASEWSVRAERQFGGPGQNNIRDFALTYALLVNKEFQAAGLQLKQMWDSGTPIADEGMPVMLAWTLLETGKPQEAAALLKFNPVPNANGLTPYASFYLPRIFYLRGKVAQKEGRDASAEFKKFLALSGDLPLIWDEEKDARSGK
jgi:Flp pilus assembly protein TadD